jgi:hypothetical protein
MNSNTCAIWGTAATHEPKIGDFSVIKSHRAGGIQYRITGTAVTQCQHLNDSQKALLTSEIIDQYISGVEVPEIDSELIEQAKKRKALTHNQKLDRFFRWLRFQNLQPGLIITLVGPDSIHDVPEGRAWIEDSNGVQLAAYVRLLIEDGFLAGTDNTSFRLTSRGYERIEKLHGINGTSAQSFVAMWFNSEVEDAYANGINEAIIASGYDVVRIDKKEHSNKIDDEIIAEIRRSRFVVADFTSGFITDKDENKTLIARGGVYYEAGFAQGLGIPVIWTCHKDCIDHLHFDTRQYAHIVWETPADLKKQLKNRIGAVIGWGPKAKL